MKKRHLFMGLLLLSPVPALAAGGAGDTQATAPSSQLQATLTIYGGGIPFGKMDLDATIRGSEYHAVSNFQTSGVVSAFWQAEIQATSSGRVAAKGLEPTLYDSFDLGHSGKKQQVSLAYESGTPRLFADPVYETRGYDVKPEEQKNTLDPLSAVMLIITGAAADASNPCGLTAPIFDGRRRYNIEISKAKDMEIKMDNGLYAGKGLLCQVKYKQLGGYKPNIIKNKDSFPTINAWIATFPSAIPGRNYVVPLRLWVDSPLGVISVVANNLKIDGQPIK